MLVEPAEHGGQACGFFGLVLLRQVENFGITEHTEIDSKVRRGARTDKKQRIFIITRLTPRVFDRQTCLSYAAQPMDRLADGETDRSPPASPESLPELSQRGIATFKERTQGVIRKIAHSAWRSDAAFRKAQFPHAACDFLRAGKRVIDVAA